MTGRFRWDRLPAFGSAHLRSCIYKYTHRYLSTVLEWQERTALLLLVAVCLIVAGAHLVLTGMGKAAFASPFSPESPDGALVSLQGTVERVTVTETGGHMILRVDGIPVFVPASSRGERIILEGDRVAVLGTVQTYRGEKEIVVQGRDDIRVLS